jgi:post-segregation antitoxin (ccd killing protein)
MGTGVKYIYFNNVYTSMQKMGIEKEHINITLPIGMADRAKKLGINMSFHAAKGIQNEIEFQEKKV